MSVNSKPHISEPVWIEEGGVPKFTDAWYNYFENVDTTVNVTITSNTNNTSIANSYSSTTVIGDDVYRMRQELEELRSMVAALAGRETGSTLIEHNVTHQDSYDYSQSVVMHFDSDIDLSGVYAHVDTKADRGHDHAGMYATSTQGELAESALQPGDNVSELTNDSGYISSVSWGDIGGTLANQTDLQSALDGKADVSSVITDHGALSGLADDDHTQYHNDTRGDARYPLKSNNLSDLASAATTRTNLGLGTFATYDYNAAPFVNVMPDSGRFAGKMNPLSLTAAGAFSNSTFFSAYNGAAVASAGKFIHNNTTHGGSAGALTATVDALISAMGRVGNDARYGVEFYVSEITAGSGTTASSVGTDSVTRYLLTSNNQRALFASNNGGTAAFWMNVASGSVHLYLATSVSIYFDGVLVPSGTPLPSGWHHVRCVSSQKRGYESLFPGIKAEIGSVVELACPAFFTGLVDTGIHTAPVPNINELSA